MQNVLFPPQVASTHSLSSASSEVWSGTGDKLISDEELTTAAGSFVWPSLFIVVVVGGGVEEREDMWLQSHAI